MSSCLGPGLRVVVKILTEPKGTFWGDKNVLYLDHSGGTGTYTCQYSLKIYNTHFSM